MCVLITERSSVRSALVDRSHRGLYLDRRLHKKNRVKVKEKWCLFQKFPCRNRLAPFGIGSSHAELVVIAPIPFFISVY